MLFGMRHSRSQPSGCALPRADNVHLDSYDLAVTDMISAEQLQREPFAALEAAAEKVRHICFSGEIIGNFNDRAILRQSDRVRRHLVGEGRDDLTIRREIGLPAALLALSRDQ